MDNQQNISRKENLNPQKRNSILKEAVEMEINEIKSEIVCNSKRRVSFADTTSIKEFLVLRDANTEWNRTYEEPVLYESSSSSISSTNPSFLINKHDGIQQEQEKNSKVVVDTTSKIQDDSFSKFLSGFLEINSDSGMLENQLDEKSSENNMELTCNTNVCFNKFDSTYPENAKDESKKSDNSFSQNHLEDETLLVQKSFEITCFSNQPFDCLNQSSNQCSFQSSDLNCNIDLNKPCNYLGVEDPAEISNLNGKHIFTPAPKIIANTHIIGLETTKPTFEGRGNDGGVSFKTNCTDMDLTAAVNFHYMENFVTKVNNCIPRKFENHEVLNSSSIEYKENKNLLFQENDQKNSFMVSSSLDDDAFCSYGQDKKPNNAFVQLKSIMDAKVKPVDMSLTVVGDTLKEDSVLDFERESIESECDIRKIEIHTKDILCAQSTDKTGPLISELNKISEFSLALAEDEMNQDLILTKKISVLNTSLPEISKVKEDCLSQLAELKDLENKGSPNAEERFGNSSINSEDKNKNLNVTYSEATKNLPLKLLEYSETSSKDKCLQSPHPERRFEEQVNNHISLVPDSKIKFAKTINKACINGESLNLETKSVTRTEDLSNLIISKLEDQDQQNMSTISSEKTCDLQNVFSTTPLPNCKTNLNSSYLSEFATEKSSRHNSFSQSSFEFLDNMAIDLMDYELIECSHPTISYIDNEVEKDASLSLNIMEKVDHQEKEQTLETDRKRKLNEENKLLEVQEDKSQYLYKLKNELRNGESHQIVGDLHAFQKVAKREISLLSGLEEGKMFHCKQCRQHKFYTNLEIFNIENFRKDVLCVNIENPQLKIKLHLTPQENHLFICAINLEMQMKSIWQKGFNFVSKALDHYFQQLKSEIISMKLCGVEHLLKKFLKSYQHILNLLKEIYFLKACFPTFAKNDQFHILVMNARKRVLVKLEVQIGFHTSQDIFNPYFSVEPIIKMGNLRKKIVEESIKNAVSMENPTLLNIIKAVYYKISRII